MEMALSHISFQIISALLVSVCDREGHNSEGSKYESLCPFWANTSQHRAVSRGTDQRPLISCNSYCSVTAVPLTQLFSYLDGCPWDKLGRNWTYLITFFCHWKNWFSSREIRLSRAINEGGMEWSLPESSQINIWKIIPAYVNADY